MKAAVGQGGKGTVGLGGGCGEEVLLLVLEFSCYVENRLQKQNHMRLLLIRDSGETSVHSLSCLQTGPTLLSHQGTDEKRHPMIS